MRTRAPALAAVVAFAVAVALVAVLAGQGNDGRLVKLPVTSLGGAGTSAEDAAGPALARSDLAYPGPFEYRVEGSLPDLPSTAPGYRLGSTTTVAAVARLAASLGLVGDVQADDNGWVVRSAERELRVERVAGLPWYLGVTCPDLPVSSDGTGGVAVCATAVDTAVSETGVGWSTGSAGSAGGCPADGCWAPVPLPAVCEPGSDCVPDAPTCEGDTVKCLPPVPTCPEGVACTMPVPEPTQPPARPFDLPSVEDASRLAKETFARLGAGTDGFVIDDGWVAWQAGVETRVDGVPVLGMGTSLSIGQRNVIVGGNGFLAVPDRIGDYPLVGAAAGLKRLTDGAGGGVGGVMGPQTLIAPAVGAPTEDGTEPAQAVAMAECGDPAASCAPPPMPMPTPTVQVVTGAHLALLHTGSALVPAYVFELADGGTVPVPAVTDEWLDTEAPAIVED